MATNNLEPASERQYVSAVTQFSSQYGAGDSEWGACNIAGPPRVYPNYGDDGRAWAPQQYTTPVS